MDGSSAMPAEPNPAMPGPRELPRRPADSAIPHRLLPVGAADEGSRPDQDTMPSTRSDAGQGKLHQIFPIAPQTTAKIERGA